jgi:hypothetical protein
MSSTPEGEARGLLVVGTPSSLRRAGDLIAAHRAWRPVCVLEGRYDDPSWRRELTGMAAVMLLVDPAVPVADAVEGTHVWDGDRPVPVGVMPDEPRAFSAAATVQRRTGSPSGPYVVLSSREDHVRARADRLHQTLVDGGVPSIHLPTGQVSRSTVLAVLASGPELVIYTGEGNPHGWAGYGRVRSWELDQLGGEPIGTLISLSCSGSERLGSLRGLCEVAVASGAAACAVGAVSEVLSEDNSRCGDLLSERLAAGPRAVSDALPASLSEQTVFRISGDPLAPLVGALESSAIHQGVASAHSGECLV